MVMVQRVEVRLIDDVDGGEADETIGFALDGVQYEIDLSEAHAAELRKAVERYVSCARRVGGRARPAQPARRQRPAEAAPATRARRDGANEKVSPKTVREWAAANGVPVNDRGRIPASILERYRAAN